ncbi:unnamed protein product [Brassica oleracea]
MQSRLGLFIFPHQNNQEHFVGIPSNSEDNVGLAASSSGPPILGDNTGEECATATPPEHANAQKKRRRGSE